MTESMEAWIGGASKRGVIFLSYPLVRAGAAVMARLVKLLRTVLQFAFVSGMGLALDIIIFVVLTGLGTAPFAANAISGACAVTFVYFASVRRIFLYRGSFLFGLFLAYLLYQVVGVTAASLAVAYLAKTLLSPLAAKLVILPITFSANYMFMSLLTWKGRQRIAASGAALKQQRC